MRSNNKRIAYIFNYLPLVILIAFSLFTAFMLILPVSAHDLQPTKSDPAAGTSVANSPDQVKVWFPEELVVDKSTLQVLDAQGKQVDLGKGGVDLNDATHQVMVVSVLNLPEGIYTVQWVVGLTDGDSAQGSFNIGIGNVVVPSVASDQPVSSTPVATTSTPIPVGYIIAGVIAVLLIILALVFFLPRRTQAIGK